MDDDNQYLAHFEKLPNISAFADTQERAIEELKLAWANAKETYKIFNLVTPYPEKSVFQKYHQWTSKK